MPPADFIHLRVHSAYSLSEGAVKIKELIKLCQKLQMPAVAITDTGNLFGALEFALAARDAGIQPIIGCQLHLRRPEAPRPGLALDPDQLVVLCQSAAGYENLMKLSSKAFLDSAPHERPQIALEDLDGHGDGLIALTGGAAGLPGRLLREGRRDEAAMALARLGGLFPGRLYVELQRHGLEGEDRIEDDLVALAYAQDLPLIATNECFFGGEDMYRPHDALLCIAGGTALIADDRRRVTPEHRFKSATEMRALFADLPEACDNSLVIARRIGFMPTTIKPLLPRFPTRAGRTEEEELRALAAEGLEARMPGVLAATPDADPAAYRARLAFELDTIIQMGFAGYFLIVSDFIQWTKAQGIPVGPGRGSGAGSVVAWALTITDLDPLRFGLLFERFLNPERVSMPDFDIDFCQDRRDEVIRYVQSKYGYDRVAQIITFGKLQARAVLRDVGRVMGMPYGQVDKICKLVPNNPANPVTLEEAVKGDPQLQALRDGDEQVRQLIETGMKLEGLYRHASTHAAGVVIGDRPLHALVPLYRDPRSDMPVTQFNMKYVEQAGLVKFDFLGLKTLTVLDVAVKLIARRGIRIDLAAVPLDDKKTFDMLARADAGGVFQLESTGMRDVLRKLKPDRFEDIIAVVALYRPGPMDNIPSYIKRKHGEEKPDYLYPTLEPILKETYGIMIYQEQVMQIAQVLAGYSLGGADLLRRAMGKKIKAEMDDQRARFVEGAAAKGVEKSKSSEIFDQVAKFAGYGFNKSHAAAYALVAYHTAYLKANYPVEFFAASMTLDLGNTDKLNLFRQELARLGVALLPPDMNRSFPDFAVEYAADGTAAVRYALGAVRNVGIAAMQALVAERDAGGPFKDLIDFARRVDPRQINRRLLENLIGAGAFDCLNPNRGQSVAAIDLILKEAQAAAEEKTSSQVNLFGGAAASEKPRLPSVSDWNAGKKLESELTAIGFYLSAHPLDEYAASLAKLKVIPRIDLAKHTGGAVVLAGTVLGWRERTSAKGSKYAFVQLSDRTGVFEITFFSETLADARPLLDSGRPLLVRAALKVEGEEQRLTAQSVEALDEAAARAGATLLIQIESSEAVEPLHTALKGAARPRGMRGAAEIHLLIEQDADAVELTLPGLFAVNATLRQQLKEISGIREVRDL